MSARRPRDLVRRALASHATVGLLAGAFLYLLCLSGSLIVMHEEWQRWEQPSVPETPAIAPIAVQRAVETVLASEAGRKPTTHLYVHLPSDALPRTVVTTDHGAVYVDAAGSPVAPEAHAWTEFLIALHYYLHLPRTWGLIAVGALGVMLASLIFGGVLAHPRIMRDAFLLRARGDARVALADWHNRLGVWTLPFGLAVSITGALLGLATLMAWVMAATWHGGDTRRVFAPVFGEEPAPRAAPASVADVAAALGHMARAHPGVRPSYVILHDPGTEGQYLQVLGDHPRRLIFGEYYAFDASGRFTRKIGMSDGALGKQLAASVYKLHFGSFGGLPVKLAYILLGLAMTVVSATGMSIWLLKRRRRGRASPRLEAMWATAVWGSPVLLALAFCLRAAAGPDAPMTGFFWGGLATLATAAALSPDAARWSSALRFALGLLLAGVGLIHAAASAFPALGPMAINAVLVAAGAAVLLPSLARRAGRHAEAAELGFAE